MALRTVYVNHTNGLASPSDAQAQNSAIGYNTWANAEAGEQDDLVTAEISLVIECVDTTTDTTALQINGSTTSSTYDIKLQVSSGARNDGTKGTGAKISAAVATGVVYPRDDNITIDGLEIGDNISGSGIYFCQFESISNLKIKNCLVYGNDSHGVYKNSSANSVTGLDFHDNFIFNNSGSGIYFIYHASDTGNAYNSVAYYNNTDESGFRGGFRATSTAIIFKNNAAFDNFNADYYSTTGDGASDEKNASSDATGDTGLINLTTADQFTDVSTPTDPDLSLKSDADLVGAGVGPSVDANVSTTSINGETRSGATTDIGAWLYASGGSSSILPNKWNTGCFGGCLNGCF